MSKVASRESAKTFVLPFHCVRHISAPEDLANDRKIYVGQVPLRSVMELPTDENVREYLLDAEGKKRHRPTQVHKAIKDTLLETPENFSTLNGGITIVARECEVDEAKKQLLLVRPSIINGSQTQGVIKDLVDDLRDDKTATRETILNTHVKFEVIVTKDDALIADVSIARNFQNDVMTISIVGRLGQLDELEEYFRASVPGAKLKKSETKLSDDYIKTERLLQVIAALVPHELIQEGRDTNKVYTYSRKAKCLKDFQDIFKKAKDEDDAEHENYANLYQFYLDIAGEAWELYEKWKCHQGFEGSRLRAIERDGRQIVDVPDGIIFPIIAAFSVFARKKKGVWTLDVPDSFSDLEIIDAAKSVYIEIANSNPNAMGKSKACYGALYQITSIYKKLSRQS